MAAFAWRIPGLKGETWHTHHPFQERLSQVDEVHGHGVHTVAQTRRMGAVIEDVSQ